MSKYSVQNLEIINLAANGSVYSSAFLIKNEIDFHEWLLGTQYSTGLFIIDFHDENAIPLLELVISRSRSWSTTLTFPGFIDFMKLFKKISIGHFPRNLGIYCFENGSAQYEGLSKMALKLSQLHSMNISVRKGIIDRVCHSRSWKVSEDGILSLNIITEEYRGFILVQNGNSHYSRWNLFNNFVSLNDPNFLKGLSMGLGLNVSLKDFEYFETLKLSFVNSMHTVMAISSLLQKGNLELDSNGCLGAKLSSLFLIEFDRNKLLAWWILKIYAALSNFLSLMKLPLDNPKVRSFVEDLWEYAMTQSERLQNLAKGDNPDTVGRILREGVKKRFIGRVIVFLAEIVSLSESSNSDSIFKIVCEHIPKDYTAEMENISNNGGKNVGYIMQKVLPDIFKFSNMLSITELNQTHELPLKIKEIEKIKDIYQKNLAKHYYVLLQAGIKSETIKNIDQVESFLSKDDLVKLELLRDSYETKFLDSESILLKDEYNRSLIHKSAKDNDTGRDCFSKKSLAMRNKVQRVFSVLEKLKNINFSKKDYLQYVGYVPYPHAFVISQGGFSPYHKAHSQLINLGRKNVVCEHYVSMRIGNLAEEEKELGKFVAELECNEENVLGILGFSTDFDVFLKGNELQHLTIGERVKIIEGILEENNDSSWIVHDTSNIFGVGLDKPPRDSSQFAESSEVLDIVFMIALAPYSNCFDCVQFRELEEKFPNIANRLKKLVFDERYLYLLNIFVKQHTVLDPEGSCDSDPVCRKKILTIFEDLSNPGLVSDSRDSKHFNNRVAAISTNKQKTRVLEEHSLYRDVTYLLSRNDQSNLCSEENQSPFADISSTRVRKAIEPSFKEEQAAIRAKALELNEMLEQSTIDFLYRLGVFFEELESVSWIQQIFLKVNRALFLLNLPNIDSINNMVAIFIGRPVGFKANTKVLSQAIENYKAMKQASITDESMEKSHFLTLTENEKLIPGTKSEVFAITWGKFISSLSENQKRDLPSVEQSSLVVLKYAVVKPPGQRCGFTAIGCRCDKRWDFILLHEKRISDKIHGKMTLEEENRAVKLGDKFANGLSDFVDRSFLRIYFYGSVNFILNNSKGQIVSRRFNSPTLNASKFMGQSSQSKPVELLHILIAAFDYDIFNKYDAFPLEDYSVFFISALQKIVRSMLFLHEIKRICHFDYIERNIMIVANEELTEGQLPVDFDVSVIDFGFGEFMDSIDSVSTEESEPRLHPRYPFGLTIGSGRPFTRNRDLGESPFDLMKQHDLSILGARTIELMLFGFRRSRFKNWKGNSATGSFNPASDSKRSTLAAALWEFPSKDSIVKDITIKMDASLILRNKILWGYQSLFLNKGNGEGDLSHHQSLLNFVQILAPRINQITSKSHVWYEDKLVLNFKSGLKLLEHLIYNKMKAPFIEKWLRTFYVDRISSLKVKNLGGHVTTNSLWETITTENSAEPGPLTIQLMNSIRNFLENIEKTDRSSCTTGSLIDLNGEVICHSDSHVKTILDNVKIVKLAKGKFYFAPSDVSISGYSEILFLLENVEYVPHGENVNVSFEELFETSIHGQHFDEPDQKTIENVTRDLVFYHGGKLGKSPTSYVKHSSISAEIKVAPWLTSSLKLKKEEMAEKLNHLRSKYFPFLAMINEKYEKTIKELSKTNPVDLLLYRKIFLVADERTDAALLSEVFHMLSLKFIRRADVVVFSCDEIMNTSAEQLGRSLSLFSVIVQCKDQVQIEKKLASIPLIEIGNKQDLESLYSSIDQKCPGCRIETNGSPKFSGFQTKSHLQAPFPWQSLLIDQNDKSITEKPKKRKTVTCSEPEEYFSVSLSIMKHFFKGENRYSIPNRDKPLSGTVTSMLLLGDSHVEYGINFGSSSWINQLQSKLSSTCLNRGASGYNTQNALEYMLPVLESEFKKSSINQEQLSLVMIWFGSIDSYIEGSIKDSMKVPLPQFKKNLRQIINRIKKLTGKTKIFVLSPLAPNEAKMMKNWIYTFEGDYLSTYKFRTVEETRNYARATESVVDEFDFPLVYVDAFEFSASLQEDCYIEDGLHLNLKGNELLYNYLLKFINQ